MTDAPSSPPDDRPPPRAPASNGWTPPPTETDLLARELGIPWSQAARITRMRRGVGRVNKVAKFARRLA